MNNCINTLTSPIASLSFFPFSSTPNTKTTQRQDPVGPGNPHGEHSHEVYLPLGPLTEGVWAGRSWSEEDEGNDDD